MKGQWLATFGQGNEFWTAALIALVMCEKGRSMYYITALTVAHGVQNIFALLYVAEQTPYLRPHTLPFIVTSPYTLDTRVANPSDLTFLAGAFAATVGADLGMLAWEKGSGPLKYVFAILVGVVSLVHIIICQEMGAEVGIHFHGAGAFGLILGVGVGLILHGLAREPLTKAGDDCKGGRPVIMFAGAAGVLIILNIIVWAIMAENITDKVKAEIGLSFVNYGFDLALYSDMLPEGGDSDVKPVMEDYFLGENMKWAGLLIAPAGAALGSMIAGKLNKDGSLPGSCGILKGILRFVIAVIISIPFGIWFMSTAFIPKIWPNFFLAKLLPTLVFAVVEWAFLLPLCKIIKLLD